MHQREDDNIFSEIPLLAYREIEDSHTAFVMLGGGKKYKEQAEKLGIKNIFFIEGTGDSEVIFSFLRTLNVFTHGRKDGEINSQAIAEALYFGLPVVSHISEINNGHVECIGDSGKVVGSVVEYKEEMLKTMKDKNYYKFRSDNAKENFKNNYELNVQINKLIEIYEDVYVNPFPNKVSRFLKSLHYTQNIRVVAVFFYLKFKSLFHYVKKF